MLNHIVEHGHLTDNPDLRKTASGVSVCNFTIAVDRSFVRQAEERQTDFFDVTCWRGLAELVSKHFRKGKEILVSGEMHSQRWEDKDGNKRTSWHIEAQTVDFCGSKNYGGQSQAMTEPSEIESETEKIQTDFAVIDDDSELPF